MKNSEIKKLIAQYNKFRAKKKKKYADSFKIEEILKEIEHRYFHEIERTLKSDLKDWPKVVKFQIT